MRTISFKAFFPLLFAANALYAVTPDQKRLPIGLTPHERTLALPQINQRAARNPPIGPVHSLAEWEEAEAVFTLWNNPSFVRALAARGRVILLADTASDQKWWESWLDQNSIPRDRISFYVVPTDSIWVRDYGPWYILDGKGEFGIVDTVYNRPRPKDDLVPQFVAKKLGLPLYQPGLVHTGGNYYNDSLKSAFSSTLVYTENRGLSQQSIQQRLLEFLGIERFTTSKLAPGITIEHIDTFGKLVSPDTWVFSEFPSGSKYRADSEAMVAKLQKLKSPYGTPYKILRMPMVKKGMFGEDYRAYINSFISNRVLYFPTYGGTADENAKRIYQQALPGYEIVGVDAMDTSWGDSVHCRSRNLLTRDTLFLFPEVHIDPASRQSAEIQLQVITSPGRTLASDPELIWSLNGVSQSRLALNPQGDGHYSLNLDGLPSGSKVSAHIEARDNRGLVKSAPMQAPEMKIEFTIP